MARKREEVRGMILDNEGFLAIVKSASKAARLHFGHDGYSMVVVGLTIIVIMERENNERERLESLAKAYNNTLLTSFQAPGFQWPEEIRKLMAEFGSYQIRLALAG
ncbi:hypothetical protein GGU11DRAFT_878081 [Lentinula aff. detonsa]|nr:hypothetical protein GGU11DRAFT_878081 [Lentinula aff. detonsa]